jgi:GTP-binding protein
LPPGTTVYDLDLGQVAADLVAPGQRLIAAHGGKGGRGNASFATASRQAPRFCQRGAPGEQRRLRLELKLLADVGIIGYPNVGKSTFISRVSAARPKIAAYPFTTLQPNLGVVKFEDFTSFVIADMPGLIVGAHQGVGLGDRFLRHVERTRLLVHMLDLAALEGRDPLQDRLDINRELRLYEERLSDLEQVMALNKMDLPQARENLPRVRDPLQAEGLPVFPISAATGEGIQPLLNHLRERLAVLGHEQEPEPPEQMVFEIAPLPDRELSVERLSDDVLAVTGTRIEKLAATTDMDADESLAWFQRQLDEQGVLKLLREAGVREGDTIVIGDTEFEYSHDQPER